MAARKEYASGAIRDQDVTKHDYEGFLSPLVVEAFGEYMNHNRELDDGSIRASDNWQLGIPKDHYMKSGWRHFFAWWNEHRGRPTKEGIVWSLLGLLFNVQGYLHELLKADPELLYRAVQEANYRRTIRREYGCGDQGTRQGHS